MTKAFEKFKEKLRETESENKIRYKLFSDFEGAFERRMLNSAWHSDGVLARITFSNGKVVLIEKSGKLDGRIVNSFGEIVKEINAPCFEPITDEKLTIQNDKELIKILEPDDDAEFFFDNLEESPQVCAYIEGTDGDANVPLESRNIATAVLQIERIRDAFPELDDPAPESVSVETLLAEAGQTSKEEPAGLVQLDVPVQKEPEKPKKTERRKRVKKTQQLVPFGIVTDFLNAGEAIKKEREKKPNVNVFDMLAKFSNNGEKTDLVYAARLFAEDYYNDPNSAISCLFCEDNMEIKDSSAAEEVISLVNRAGELYLPVFSGNGKKKSEKDRNEIVFNLLTAARITDRYPVEVKEILGVPKEFIKTCGEDPA